jgi:hypothetical protein
VNNFTHCREGRVNVLKLCDGSIVLRFEKNIYPWGWGRSLGTKSSIAVLAARPSLPHCSSTLLKLLSGYSSQTFWVGKHLVFLTATTEYGRVEGPGEF